MYISPKVFVMGIEVEETKNMGPDTGSTCRVSCCFTREGGW